MQRARLEAFSDGVFAVAITLLALNLVVAGPGHGRLVHQLGDHWPAFVAYLISFFTIGIIWVNHHALLDNVAVVNRTLLFLNLVLLMFVVVIPFATATLADYLRAGGQDAHLAMAMYATVFLGTALGFTVIFEWVLRGDRTHHPVPMAQRRAARWRFSIGLLFYLIAIAVAFVSAPTAMAIVGAVAVYYIVERTPATGSAAEPQPPAGSQRPDRGAGGG